MDLPTVWPAGHQPQLASRIFRQQSRPCIREAFFPRPRRSVRLIATSKSAASLCGHISCRQTAGRSTPEFAALESRSIPEKRSRAFIRRTCGYQHLVVGDQAVAAGIQIDDRIGTADPRFRWTVGEAWRVPGH